MDVSDNSPLAQKMKVELVGDTLRDLSVRQFHIRAKVKISSGQVAESPRVSLTKIYSFSK